MNLDIIRNFYSPTVTSCLNGAFAEKIFFKLNSVTKKIDADSMQLDLKTFLVATMLFQFNFLRICCHSNNPLLKGRVVPFVIAPAIIMGGQLLAANYKVTNIFLNALDLTSIVGEYAVSRNGALALVRGLTWYYGKVSDRCSRRTQNIANKALSTAALLLQVKVGLNMWDNQKYVTLGLFSSVMVMNYTGLLQKWFSRRSTT